jgi:hypothetical protein
MFRLFGAILLLFSIFQIGQFQQQRPVSGTGTTAAKKATKEIIVENVQFAVFGQDANQPDASNLHKFFWKIYLI